MLTLNDYINSRLSGTELNQATYAHASFYQELLTLISSLYTAAILNSDKTPPGFTSLFTETFSAPVHGKILNGFLLSVSDPSPHRGLDKLSAYLQKFEKKGDGWFQQLLVLRNEFAHPKQHIEDILTRTNKILEYIPDFSPLGFFTIDEQAMVIWNSGDERISLNPFVVVSPIGELEVFNQIDAHGELVFSQEAPNGVNAIFRRLWSGARIQDPLLSDPTAWEIKQKVMSLRFEPTTNHIPVWTEDIVKKKSLAFLVEESSIVSVLFRLKNIYPDILILPVEVENGGDPVRSLFRLIGIRQPDSFVSFLKILNEENVIVAIKTDSLDRKSFLQIILLVHGLFNKGLKQSIKFLIGRSEHLLKEDSTKLVDRLPETMKEYYAIPPGRDPIFLDDFLWKTYQRKKFLGLF